MPFLGFGKEGLDPDLAFAHRLLVGLGDGAVDHAAMLAGRALGLDEASIADPRVRAIDDLVFGVLGLPARQELPLRAAVGVLNGIVAELPFAKKRRASLEVRQWEEGADARILERDDVLGGPVGGIAGHLLRPDLPPEADPPE